MVERETSSIMELGYGLALLSALLAIVLSGVFIGKKVGYDFFNQAEVMQQELQEGSFRDLNYSSIEMPTASLVSLIKSNEENVYMVHDNIYNLEGKLSIYGSNGTIEDSDVYSNIKQHITGRVRVYVEYNKIESGYEIWLHDIGCLNPYNEHVLGGC